MPDPVILPDAGAPLMLGNRMHPDWYRLFRLFADAYNRSVGDIDNVEASVTRLISQGFNLINGTITESHDASNALTIAVKTMAGADASAASPVYIVFRNVSPASGSYSVLTITAALSVTISSGSTLGFASGTPGRLWLVAFNDNNTARLAVINCLNLANMDIYPLAAWDIASAIQDSGGGSDSSHAFYAPFAITNKAYTILGYLTWESGLTTAGTWNASPTRIQIKHNSVPNPGCVVQPVHNQDGVSATLTDTIPADNTIPQQSTEGTLLMSKAITPSSAANVLDIECQANLATSAAAGGALTLHQDSVEDALSVAFGVLNSANARESIQIRHRMQAATTAQTTFKTQAGPNSAATLTFNGVAGSQTYAGRMNSYMHIDELMA